MFPKEVSAILAGVCLYLAFENFMQEQYLWVIIDLGLVALNIHSYRMKKQNDNEL